ncbi:hypothetical protein [Geochorda subterranea]|uniref:Nucleoside recognition protein n=1 Tax=Geochorda subterranea TaxID=3109564 RepID=A0ABZ1BN03_9FIRM|nr:hypothetical protein [Limnochorda sp. LNt]WRP13880.1 hypothetical protein VLY81_10610 [Limnochorda sp. LNt]
MLHEWWHRFAKTLGLLLRIVVPVYMLVVLLEATGWIGAVTGWVERPLGWLGIAEPAVLPLLVGLFSALYAAIGTMASLGLTPEQALPVVLFLNFAHALPMEVAVASRCRVDPWRITAVRLAMAAAAALLAPLLVPLLPQAAPGMGGAAVAPSSPPLAPAEAATVPPLAGALVEGLRGLMRLLALLVAVLAPATLAMAWLEHRGLLDRWSAGVGPWMRRLGLSGDAAFPVLAGLFLGLVYGAGVLIDRMGSGRLSEQEAWRVFVLLAACHSVLEDPFIFTAVGVGPHILLPVRVAAAVVVLAGFALAGSRRRAPQLREAPVLRRPR